LKDIELEDKKIKAENRVKIIILIIALLKIFLNNFIEEKFSIIEGRNKIK